jgi:gamma-glutamylputrescine oxidase
VVLFEITTSNTMQYELSYWEKSVFFDQLDAVIIGSGLVGLNAAIELRTLHPSWKIAILERGPLPIGASTRNAGFACFGSMTELLDDLTHLSMDEMLAIVEKRWRGLQQLRQVVGDTALHFQELGGYEMFTERDEAIHADCLDRMDEFNREMGRITGSERVYRIADERLPALGFSSDVSHLILNSAEGQVHTGYMMKALLDKAQAFGIVIYNGLGVNELHDNGDTQVELVTTAGWSLFCRKVLVCTNGFARQLLPELAVTPARNQVLITRPIPQLQVSGCFHYDRGYFYFRNQDGRLLLGGGRNLDLTTEQTDQFGSNEMIREALTNLLHKVICPSQPVEVEQWWTGILGLGPVKKPIVQLVSTNVVCAVRLSGMGVAIGTLIGQEGAHLVSAHT